MICPSCGGDTEALNLLDVNKEHFDIDRCAHCGGIWLDRGKLDRLTHETAEETDSENSGGEFDSIGINCPRCYIPLEEYHHPRLGTGTFLRCPDCHGLWLRRGQLYDYFRLKDSHNVRQPDAYGTLTKRDRVLVAFSSFIIVAMLGGFLISLRTGSLPLAASEIRSPSGSLTAIWIILLIIDIILVGVGLTLALFKAHRLVKWLGWGMVIASLIILAYLAHV